MNDLKKLPKWAQTRIAEAEAARAPINKTGAEISGCHIENNGVRHDEHSAAAISSIADAIGKNADALKELAKSVSGSGVEVNFGDGIHLSHIQADNEA